MKTEKNETPEIVIDNSIERLLMQGNLDKLTPEQCVDYHNAVCKSLGLNPLTQPFEYLTFQGKKRLYATKNCAEQLRRVHRVSISGVSEKIHGDLLIMTATASMPDGRTDQSTAALTIKGLKDTDLAVAVMKCETKAKRRVTLSICGLGMLDETEVDDLPADPKTVRERIKQIESAAEPVTVAAEVTDPAEYRLQSAKAKNKGRALRDIGVADLQKAISDPRVNAVLTPLDAEMIVNYLADNTIIEVPNHAE